MSGGLDIRFFGRESRKRGVPEQRLEASCHELVEPVLDVMLHNPDTIEVSSNGSPHIEDRVMEALDEALQLVEFEHRHCGWAPPEYQDCPIPDIRDQSAAASYKTLLNEWGTTTEVFMDTLCAHLQFRDLTDRTALYRDAPEGWADNRRRRDRLIELLNDVLAPHGFHITSDGEVVLAEHSGTFTHIEGPSLEALDKVGWSEVSAKMHAAVREIHEGNYGDAVTDVGTGLQSAFRHAGYRGKTLGDQVKEARGKITGAEDLAHRGRTFAGVHSKLGEAADNLSQWIASVRNIRSDAHDGEEATRAEADLTLRTGLALAAWLADGQEADETDRTSRI